MVGADEQQIAGTGQPEGAAPVGPPPEPGQPAALESASDTTGQQAPDDAPPAAEAQVEKWNVNTDLSQLSPEQLAEGLTNPENAEIARGHLLRDRDYREKTTKLANERRALEEIRGRTINLDETQQPTPPPTPPVQTLTDVEQMAREQVAEFMEQHPGEDGDRFAVWQLQRIQQMIAPEVQKQLQPLRNENEQAEAQRIRATVDADYQRLAEEFPHAAEPGVQDAVYDQIAQWDPKAYTPDIVRQAYMAANADRFVPRQAGQPQQPAPATRAPQQPGLQPQPPRAQPLPPAARKGTEATPVYDNPEDMIEAMMADTELASKLHFPDSTSR